MNAVVGKYLSVSQMLGLCSGGFLRGLHHRFLHSVFACPIQTDQVAIGIIEVGMSPTPGHHAWQLGDVEAFLLELAAEVVKFSDFEILTHTLAVPGLLFWVSPFQLTLRTLGREMCVAA
jgi:hypothetical protein